MKILQVVVPAKIHLIGEHSVVYGNTAVLAAVALYCKIKLLARKDKKIHISFENHSQTFSFAELFDYMSAVRKFPTFFDAIVFAIGKALSSYDRTYLTGCVITISLTIPLGSGMGSSASIAVAATGISSLFLTEAINREKINDISFAIEQVFHTNPSGADNTTVCFGGVVIYKKNNGKKIFKKSSYTLPEFLQKNFYLLDTGRPVETTSEMVERVKTYKENNSNSFEKFLSSQEELAKKLIVSLRNSDEEMFKFIINQAQKNLNRIGVVSEKTQKLIQTIEKNGGVAKISGAGGYKENSGVVIVYHSERKIVQDIAKDNSIQYQKIHIDTKGIQLYAKN